jgi:hypothetical protein
VIGLVADIVVAMLTLSAEKLRLRATSSPVESPPAGAGSPPSTGTGGHPYYRFLPPEQKNRPTSELLNDAALRIALDPRHSKRDEVLAAELRDRAKFFAVLVGD